MIREFKNNDGSGFYVSNEKYRSVLFLTSSYPKEYYVYDLYTEDLNKINLDTYLDIKSWIDSDDFIEIAVKDKKYIDDLLLFVDIKSSLDNLTVAEQLRIN